MSAQPIPTYRHTPKHRIPHPLTGTEGTAYTITHTHTHSHPLSEKELSTVLLQLFLNEPETWTHVSYFESRMDLNLLEKTKQNKTKAFSFLRGRMTFHVYSNNK